MDSKQSSNVHARPGTPPRPMETRKRKRDWVTKMTLAPVRPGHPGFLPFDSDDDLPTSEEVEKSRGKYQCSESCKKCMSK